MAIIKCNRCNWTRDSTKQENHLDKDLQLHFEQHQFADMLKSNYTILPNDQMENRET